ncbi:MAG: MmgE/PrpD family protein [Fimbriimonadaceae bacterium]|nr:MmgE/PrpD family protein [Fimbriimonadaceae bacterium]QYK54938.1 MAG: MmgE/PrpD family protein [Fimbriimonadaceae bacterium]
MPTAASTSVSLGRDTNQALGIGRFAIDFVNGRLGEGPSQAVLARTKLFHTDAVLCGLSALALGTNAPTVLREEALQYRCDDPSLAAFVFGSNQGVFAEKAILANCSAVREWDSNGTNFGYRPELGNTAGEFGHNDFYPVVVAACQQRELDGATALRAMVALDEIRGRLAEVFSLKTHKIDHVVHGAIASAAVYGALLGATAEQIESAIGMFVAHFIPWRAIRAGKQLSDSKGASAAISTEAAVTCLKRSMAGFRGPRDIFRNPEAVWRFFEPTTEGAERWKETGDSPFDLELSHSGDDFAVMGMHFKLGLYEHQSAGALQAVIDMVAANPAIVADQCAGIEKITILAYEPAFGIIGNPAKKDPRTRQSADHSMAYIVATLLRKASEASPAALGAKGSAGNAHLWKSLMLLPQDYELSEKAIFNPVTRALMQKIEFRHGGADYDAKYPDGIPTSLSVTMAGGAQHESGLVMYPGGHARNETVSLTDVLGRKFGALAELAFADQSEGRAMVERLEAIDQAAAHDLAALFDVEIANRDYADDPAALTN